LKLLRVKDFTLYAFLTLCLGASSYAQKQANVWQFGHRVGLDFNYTPPEYVSNGKIAIDGISTDLESSASIANQNGELLFYTNGMTVWNRLHEVMPNGTDLWGDNTTTQTIIVPKPQSSTHYYIFTASPGGDSPVHPIEKKGFRYSVVDMTLEGGLGDVVEKNVLLSASTTEKVAATMHINGTDVWVVMHEWTSDTFRAYLVSEDGIGAQPVLSQAGSVHSGPPDYAGQMKFSPSGETLGLVVYHSALVETFHFNPSNGMLSVSNSLSLVDIISGGYLYGVEFSPSGRYLYISANRCHIYQIDLTTSGENNIAKVSDSPPCFGSNQLQLAPDGKIYIGQSNRFILGVINKPDEHGMLCEYIHDGINFPVVAGHYCGDGLPNFISSYFLNTELYPLRPYFEMPNVFTPNGDGYNDRFVPMVNYNVASATLAVYNRWGEQVHQTTNLESGWDGGECSAGMYFWIVRYLGTNGKRYFQKGTVQLIR
jgi:gliding motility-associated-like protein